MNDDSLCLFCKIVSGEILTDKVYEDEDIYAFLDIKPINPGHTLVVPKKHYKNLYELPDDILQKVSLVFKKIAIAIKKGLETDGVNIGMNNDEAAGQVIFHSHIHVIPRYKNDGYVHWKGKDLDKNKVKEIINKISKELAQN